MTVALEPEVTPAPAPQLKKVCSGKCVDVRRPRLRLYADRLRAVRDACTRTRRRRATSGACALGALQHRLQELRRQRRERLRDQHPDRPAPAAARAARPASSRTRPRPARRACAASRTCDIGWTDCNNDPTDGCEANLQNDPMNCGACGMACHGQQACQQGVCGLICAKGTANCPGDPTNVCATTLGTQQELQLLRRHLRPGELDLAVRARHHAAAGARQRVHPPELQRRLRQLRHGRDERLRDEHQTDANNCGSCGNVCPSGPHSTAVCNNGGCGLTATRATSTATTTRPTAARSTATATYNCGGCGHVCTSANGTAAARAAVHHLAAPPASPTATRRWPTGARSTPRNDPKNCGTCGTLCSESNGNAVCATGIVQPGPRATRASRTATAKYTTGCNVNSNTDPNNCGGCNDVCNLPNATSTCSTGQCTIASCNSGFQNCDNVASNGCEATPPRRPRTAAACGNVATRPTPRRRAPTARAPSSCNPNFANCDGNIANGCEVNTQTDPNNCGGCGVKCALANASATLHDGACTIASCTNGFADCDKNPSDGCEVNIDNDPNNCGGCGNACSLPHATANCSGGVCGVSSCTAGFAELQQQRGGRLRGQHHGDPEQLRRLRTRCAARRTATPGCSSSALHHRELRRGLRQLRRQRGERLRGQHHQRQQQLRRVRQRLRRGLRRRRRPRERDHAVLRQHVQRPTAARRATRTSTASAPTAASASTRAPRARAPRRRTSTPARFRSAR